MVSYKYKNGNCLFKYGKDRFKRVRKQNGYPAPAFTKAVKANPKMRLPKDLGMVYNRRTNRWLSVDHKNRLQRETALYST